MYRSLILTNLSFIVGWTARHFLETACFILWKAIQTFKRRKKNVEKLNLGFMFGFLDAIASPCSYPSQSVSG